MQPGPNGRELRGRSDQRLFRNVRYAFSGTWDGGNEVALATFRHGSCPFLGHVSGENVPRAWKFVPVWFTEAF